MNGARRTETANVINSCEMIIRLHINHSTADPKGRFVSVPSYLAVPDTARAAKGVTSAIIEPVGRTQAGDTRRSTDTRHKIRTENIYTYLCRSRI